MSITEQDIVIYASQNMPTDDASLAGGDIDSSVRMVFTDITSTGTIAAQSSNATDSGTLTVTGRNQYGSIFSESFPISGTTAVSGSEVFERIGQRGFVLTFVGQDDNVTYDAVFGLHDAKLDHNRG